MKPSDGVSNQIRKPNARFILPKPAEERNVMACEKIASHSRLEVHKIPVRDDNSLPPQSDSTIMAASSHIMVTSRGCEKKISFLPEGQFLAIQSPMPVFIKGNDWTEQKQRLINQVNIPRNPINYTSTFKRILPKPPSCEMVDVSGFTSVEEPPPPQQPRHKTTPSVKNYLKILRPRNRGKVDGSRRILNLTETSQAQQVPKNEFKKILLPSKPVTDSAAGEGTSAQNTMLEASTELKQNETDKMIVPKKLIHVLPENEENSDCKEQFILPDMPESGHIQSAANQSITIIDDDDDDDDDGDDGDDGDETTDANDEFEVEEEKFIINNETKEPSTSGFKKIVLPNAPKETKTGDEAQEQKYSIPEECRANSIDDKKIMLPSTSNQSFGYEHFKTKMERDLEQVTPNSNNRYECTTCGRSYQIKEYYENHLKYECGKEPLFRCTRCPYQTFHSSNLRNHFHLKHVI